MAVRTAALLLTGLTGFTGLVYEVTWQKYLGTLLGSQSEATAAILAIFLGGLSVGYSLFGRVTTRISSGDATAAASSRLLLVYGGIEAAIGIYAFLFHRLFLVVQAISVQVPADNPLLAFGFDVALATLLIGPASVMMGATIPMLTQALSRQLEDATRFHALVYATNTTGAFAGALAAGFWLVPSLGLVRVLYVMGALNIAAGIALAGLGLAIARNRGEATQGAADSAAPAEVRGIAWYSAVALLTGFAMMTFQTVLIRVSGLALGSSQFTFSMVVAAFVACIALGSFAVSLLPRISPSFLVANQWILTALLVLLYTQIDDAPYWAHQLRIRFGDSPSEMLPYYASAFGALVAIVGLPIALSGAVLPLLFHHLRGQFGDLGAVAGRLYAWNTTGSLLGALVGGYLLFFWLDLHQVFRAAVAVLALSAGLLAIRVAGAGIPSTAVLLAVCFTGLATLAPWSPERLSSGLFRLRQAIPGGYAGGGPGGGARGPRGGAENN
jgi:spermidine synthase